MGSTTPRSSALAVWVSLFGLGLLAVLGVFGLFATGYQDLPLWLNLATLLAPAGLIGGVITLIVRASRNARRTTPGTR